MNSLWRIVRAVMAVIGGLLMFGAVGTSDYYTLELRQPEPSSVWTTMLIGFLMMLPMFVHLINEYRKEHME